MEASHSMLQGMFKFPGISPESNQAANIALLEHFTSALTPGNRTEPKGQYTYDFDSFSSEEISCVSTLMKTISSGELNWYGNFGCCIITEFLSSAGQCTIKVVGLDNWSFVTSMVPGVVRNHSTKAAGSNVIPLGTINSENPKETTRLLFSKAALVIQSIASKTVQRGKLSGRKVEKSPAFISEVYVHTMSELMKLSYGEAISLNSPAPKGGTTDVGSHQGSEPGDACWDLVCSVLRELIRTSGCTLPDYKFIKIQVHFYLKLLEDRLEKAASSVSELIQNEVDLQFVILDTVSLLVFPHADNDQLKVEELVGRCKAARVRLNRIVIDYGLVVERRYQLSTSDSPPAPPGVLELPSKGVEPPLQNQRHESLEWNRMLGLLNIASVDVLVVEEATKFSEALNWITRNELNKDLNMTKVFLALSTVDKLFIYKAQMLFTSKEDLKALVELGEQEALDALVNLYDNILHNWLLMEESHHFMFVKQISNQLLVRWIACCLQHFAVVSWSDQPELVSQYAMPLDWRDLQCAVLDDREAREALKIVARYIKSQSVNKRSPLFHLNEQSGTI